MLRVTINEIINILLFFTLVGNCEIFTSMADVEKLAKSQENILEIVSSYIEIQTIRLEELKKLMERLSHEIKMSNAENEDNILNPINAYQMIKKLMIDWKTIQNLTSVSADEFLEKLDNKFREREIIYTTKEDLIGAAIGIQRLQDTYQMDTHDLASGNILGKDTGFKLSSHDCFNIGKAAYDRGDFYHTILWMNESMNLIKTEKPPLANLEDVIEHLAFALYKQDNVERALSLTRKLYEINSEHPLAEGNIKWYESILKDKESGALPPIKLSRFFEGVPDRDVYEALCRGDDLNIENNYPDLYCYLKMDRPFLRVAPIKVEILYRKPLVVMFRNVISDKEILVIKKLSAPKLKRATVQNAKTGKLESASFRVSKSAWIKEHESPVIKQINARIDLMTNLNQETSEDIQVANYGIGGHYESHYDMSTKDVANPYKKNMGNRIATLLFYISDVEKGGGTIFITEKIAVLPSLHDALFWYNLRKDGEPDLKTLHAACPVLLGTKWVSNKWIHERGQEFRRPCGLTPESAEKYIGDLD